MLPANSNSNFRTWLEPDQINGPASIARSPLSPARGDLSAAVRVDSCFTYRQGISRGKTNVRVFMQRGDWHLRNTNQSPHRGVQQWRWFSCASPGLVPSGENLQEMGWGSSKLLQTTQRLGHWDGWDVSGGDMHLRNGPARTLQTNRRTVTLNTRNATITRWRVILDIRQRFLYLHSFVAERSLHLSVA